MKTLLVKGQFNPLTYQILNDIRKYKKDNNYHKVIILGLYDNKIIHTVNKAMVNGFRHIEYVTSIKNNSYDIYQYQNIWDDYSQLVRWGNYQLVNSKACLILNDTMIYYDEMLKHYLKEKRYNHTYSMCQCALEIASCNNIDLKLVKQACLCHDICKNMDDDLLYKYTYAYNKECISQPKPIWHQFAGAYFVKYNLRINNNKIVNAIANHTTGNINSPLARVVYIADKCDPGRGWDSSESINLSKKRLSLGYTKVHKDNVEYVNGELKNGK